jgi:beta-glucanase (GH16 family)
MPHGAHARGGAHRRRRHNRTLAVAAAAAIAATAASALPIIASNSRPTVRPVAETTPSTPPASSSAPLAKPTTTPPATTAPATKQTTKPTTKPIKKATTNRPANPAGWKLVWSDEFTGSNVDMSKWNLRTDEGRSIDKGCNTNSPRNTFVTGGSLTLRALREASVCSSQTRQYTQGYLDTIGKASWTYGRFEMRAKSPNKPDNSAGLWPAFWLRPVDGGNGEIDVTELPGGRDWYRKSTAAIFYDYSPVKQDTRVALPGGGYPGDGFHTYVTEWDAQALRWYIDGKLVWTRDRTTTSWYDNVFHKPYNIRLNFQVGGWLGDPDAATKFPADFVVDYVRVYQH